MNHDQIKRIADAYVAAEHTPEHPSYRAFVAETLEQYRVLRMDNKTRIYTVRGIAYGSSVDLFHDLARYNRMAVSIDGSPLATGHPLSRRLQTVPTANDAFRAVHDYFGHYLGRHPFETFEGEIEAYKEHARRYSPEALPALYSETVAQLCYFYAYGSFVPVQKAAILPMEVIV